MQLIVNKKILRKGYDAVWSRKAVFGRLYWVAFAGDISKF